MDAYEGDREEVPEDKDDNGAAELTRRTPGTNLAELLERVK